MKSWKLGAALVLLLGSYLAFPYYATRALGEALRSGEPAQLERAIDFDALRASLRSDLDARGREMLGDGPMVNELADLFGGALLGNAVEVYVTPPALATLIESGDLAKAAVAGVIQPDANKDFEIQLRDASWAFFADPTTFAVELPNAALKLRLQNWWWQLVEIQPKRSDPGKATARPAPAPEPPAVEAAPPTILVSVNVKPWATIAIDGVDMGETPLADIPLTEGPHRFRARLPDDRVIERTEMIDAAHARIELR
jgi:hypothetical protein